MQLRRKLFLLAAALALAIPCTSFAQSKTLGAIERIDPKFDDLVAKDAIIEMLVEKSFKWSEGPVWSKEHKAVLFDVFHAARGHGMYTYAVRITGLWIAVVIYVLFSVSDLMLIPDVAAYTITARFAVGLTALLTLEAQLRRGAATEWLDITCAAAKFTAS